MGRGREIGRERGNERENGQGMRDWEREKGRMGRGCELGRAREWAGDERLGERGRMGRG